MIKSNSVYKFIDIEDEHNLKNNELYCKYFDSFNDPYEGHFGVSSVWPCPYKNYDELKVLISSLSPDTADKNIASRENMIAYINNKGHIREKVHDLIYKKTDSYRICSFTRRWNNILMWSHYSNGGRGAVLVFDQSKLLKSDYIHEVQSK